MLVKGLELEQLSGQREMSSAPRRMDLSLIAKRAYCSLFKIPFNALTKVPCKVGVRFTGKQRRCCRAIIVRAGIPMYNVRTAVPNAHALMNARHSVHRRHAFMCECGGQARAPWNCAHRPAFIHGQKYFRRQRECIEPQTGDMYV